MKKWIIFCLAGFMLWAYSEELPISQWHASGPHDEIADGVLTLKKHPVRERRPEIYQHADGLVKNETYEILFTACLPKAGGGLELHIDFADTAHYRFSIEAQNTVWNTYKYEFKAGEGTPRITFLLSTGEDIPNEARIRNVIVRPKGELLAPAFQRSGNLRIGREYLSYDIEPDKSYRLLLEARGKFTWTLELMDYDRRIIGHTGGEGTSVDKIVKFPPRTAFLKLTLTSGGTISKMEKISLRKIEYLESVKYSRTLAQLIARHSPVRNVRRTGRYVCAFPQDALFPPRG